MRTTHISNKCVEFIRTAIGEGKIEPVLD